VKICPACSREYGDERDVCPQDGASLVHLDTGAGGRPEELVGEVVDGRYRIERIVGRGGMGTVYAVRHVIVGKAFAMKVLRPGIERSEEILQRFIREAQTANTIPSRHICQMIDFGQLRGKGGAFYVVMDLLEGPSFTKALRDGLLDRVALERVFVQIAETLEKAHVAGIIHRDLKPDNVMLVEEDGDPFFVKLVDFGIAKAMQSQAGHLTETGVILGTPFYMSPEQARGDSVDGRSDIYALGVMMYRAFTGKLPFVADSAMGVLTRHLTEEPEAPSRIREIEPALERLILCCLAKQPESRFQRMAHVAVALRALRDPSISSSAQGVPASRVAFSSNVPYDGAGVFPGSESVTSSSLARSGVQVSAGPRTRDDGSITALRPDAPSGPYALGLGDSSQRLLASVPHGSGPDSAGHYFVGPHSGAQSARSLDSTSPSHPGETNRGLVASPHHVPASNTGRRFALLGGAAAAFVTIGAIVAIAVMRPDDPAPAAPIPARVNPESITEDASDRTDDHEAPRAATDPPTSGDAVVDPDAGTEDPTDATTVASPPPPVVVQPPRPAKRPPEPAPEKTPKKVDDGVRSPFEDSP
jgi:serine/threonine protein kinase